MDSGKNSGFLLKTRPKFMRERGERWNQVNGTREKGEFIKKREKGPQASIGSQARFEINSFPRRVVSTDVHRSSGRGGRKGKGEEQNLGGGSGVEGVF